MKILMVCLGNICRSPLAEGILKHKVQQLGLPWTVDSAGTGHWHTGELPDRRSIAVARRYGIDLTDQRARQFRPDDFERFDRILVMDTQNCRDVLRLAQSDEHRAKVGLILDLTHPGEERSVPDPYYDDDGFEQVFQMLDTACEVMVSVTG
ncbi:MAG: low molecular weight phosphotyrosine protein phosphatase [Saprospiraceae bacterium]|jgi:protein-tyrosine phosphatase|nr:low molecular weight phosphotyrosine protein phosphatase [Saprospiraceae bacterium]